MLLLSLNYHLTFLWLDSQIAVFIIITNISNITIIILIITFIVITKNEQSSMKKSYMIQTATDITNGDDNEMIAVVMMTVMTIIVFPFFSFTLFRHFVSQHSNIVLMILLPVLAVRVTIMMKCVLVMLASISVVVLWEIIFPTHCPRLPYYHYN